MMMPQPQAEQDDPTALSRTTPLDNQCLTHDEPDQSVAIYAAATQHESQTETGQQSPVAVLATAFIDSVKVSKYTFNGCSVQPSMTNLRSYHR